VPARPSLSDRLAETGKGREVFRPAALSDEGTRGKESSQAPDRLQETSTVDRKRSTGDRGSGTDDGQPWTADRKRSTVAGTPSEAEGDRREVSWEASHRRVTFYCPLELLDAVEAEAAALAEAFADRIARLYKQGPELAIEMLFAAEDAEDALARTVMLQHVMQGDQIDLESLPRAD
jgi:hypothetical protein